MRHVVAIACLIFALSGALLILDGLHARDFRPGTVWIVELKEPTRMVRNALEVKNAQLVNSWAGGRIIQLRVDSLAQTVLPGGTFTVRAGSNGLAMFPACAG